MFSSQRKFYNSTENKVLNKSKLRTQFLFLIFQRVLLECRDGKIQRCSRWIIKFSSYFSEKINENDDKKTEIKFDCTKYSHETIKLFLDIVHGINDRNIPIVLFMDLLVFLSANDKLGQFCHVFL